MKKLSNLKLSQSIPPTTDIEPGNSNATASKKDELPDTPHLSTIQNMFDELSTSDVINNITIADSSNIHLGNKINYNGSLYVSLVNNNKSNTSLSLIHNDIGKEVVIEAACSVEVSDLPIIRRRFWSTRKPVEQYQITDEPVKLVIISHTATTSSIDHSKNIQLIRDIQAFHIDTHNWNDIGYNFLIGCDGLIYEGRGWGIEGAHAFGYNNRSVGISFIGCFINRLPTEKALNSCRNLLQRGIEGGHLAKNYKLLGHRQCSETESPGTKLYEEIKTWDNFYEKTVDEDVQTDEE